MPTPVKHQTVCVLAFSDIRRDSRVLRAIRVAREMQCRVVVVARGPWEPKDERIEYLRVPKMKADWPRWRLMGFLAHAGIYAPAAWRLAYWLRPEYRMAYRLAAGVPSDLVIANDSDTLPIAIRLRQHTGCRVLFDAHEYEPGQPKYVNRELKLKEVEARIRHFASMADEMTTVGDGIATLYRENFGVESCVILNIPHQAIPEPQSIDRDGIRIVHAGIDGPHRNVPLMIKMMPFLPPHFSLDLFLIDERGDHCQELREMADDIAPGRVNILPAVPSESLLEVLSGYDIGIHIPSPVCESYRLALPNKFFQFMAAGLAVVIGPSPEMAKIVNTYGMGIVVDELTPEAVARSLSSLDEAVIMRMRQNARCASKHFDAEGEVNKLKVHYGRLLGRTTNDNP